MLDDGFAIRALNTTLAATGDLALIWLLLRVVRIGNTPIRRLLFALAILHSALSFLLISPLRVFFLQLDYDPRAHWYLLMEQLEPVLWISWAFTCAMLATLRMRNARRFHLLVANLASLGPPPPPHLTAELSRLAASAGIAAPALAVLDLPVTSPFVVGLIRPVLVFPRALHALLTPRELRSVLAHEVAHLRARDALSNVVLELLRTVFVFNPPFGALIRGYRKEVEKLRDGAACHMTGAPRSLAAALLKVLDRSRLESLPAAGASHSTFLQLGLRNVRERLDCIAALCHPARTCPASLQLVLCFLVVPWQFQGSVNAAAALRTPRLDLSERSSLLTLGVAAKPNPLVAKALSWIGAGGDPAATIERR